MSQIEVVEKQYTAKEFLHIAGVVKELIEKNNPSGTTPTVNPPYGPYQDGSARYGTFSYPGMRPGMYSALQRTRSLCSYLGIRESMMTNDKVGIMTGATDSAGTNPADFCGTAPTPGQLKRCVQNYIFGKHYWKTNVANIAEAGEYIDTSDMTKRIENLRSNPNPLIPDIVFNLDLQDRNSALLSAELFNLGIAMERSLEKVIVRGNKNTAPGSTQRGWIKEFEGLERQVTTGRVDLDTGVACAAADSQTFTWGTGIDQSVNGRTFVQMLTDYLYGLRDIAEQTGFTDAQWIIVMPYRMFRPLTFLWACQYYTQRCQASASNLNYTDANTITNFQLEMMNGQFLLADNIAYPVVFSDGILETRASATSSTYTASEIFILPVSWAGGSLLNMWYKKMDNAEAMSFAQFAGANMLRSINNGMYLVTTNFQNFCYEHLFASKMRLIQEAPFLAGQISTIQYQFVAPYRAADPADTISYVNGGATVWDGNMTVS